MTNRTSPKTPYEIRLELLQLAQVILHEKHKSSGEVDHRGILVVKSSPTTEEIIAEAEKMNQFISKGNQ